MVVVNMRKKIYERERRWQSDHLRRLIFIDAKIFDRYVRITYIKKLNVISWYMQTESLNEKRSAT